MMVMNLLNGDEYACFVVLRLGNTIYFQYFNGFKGEFWLFIYRDYSSFFPDNPRDNVYIHVIEYSRSRVSAKVEPRSREGSLYIFQAYCNQDKIKNFLSDDQFCIVNGCIMLFVW